MTTPTRRAIADQIVGAAASAGTTHAFGVPGGGSNLDVAGACAEHDVEFVLVHMESSAAVMASVMGELTGAPGIAVGTRGPGLAAAVNGVANALIERSPLLMITDCVPAADRPRVSHQRFDQQALMSPISFASRALNGQDSDLARQMVALTTVQPPGPVHIDIDPTASSQPVAPRSVAELNSEPLLALVRAARRPVIIAGVGVVCLPPPQRTAVVEAINELAGRTHTPVLTTYKARGVVPDGAEYSAGIVTGSTIEGQALRDADLIIGIGFDTAELLPTPWSYEAPVVLAGSWLVDDSDFIGSSVRAVAVGDLNALVKEIDSALTTDWELGAGQRYWALLETAARTTIDQPARGLTPAEVVTITSAAAPRGAIATVDAGAHMLVAMPLWKVDAPQQLLISSSYATMGFSIPAAVAASLARPGTPVIAFTGDGGAGMVLAELETIARLGRPVIVVVFNDSLLSLIAVKQSPSGQGGSGAVAYGRTDFAAIAAGCGLPSWQVADAQSLDEAIRAALASGGPALIDAVVDPAGYPAIYDALRG